MPFSFHSHSLRSACLLLPLLSSFAFYYRNSSRLHNFELGSTFSRSLGSYFIHSFPAISPSFSAVKKYLEQVCKPGIKGLLLAVWMHNLLLYRYVCFENSQVRRQQKMGKRQVKICTAWFTYFFGFSSHPLLRCVVFSCDDDNAMQRVKSRQEKE